MEVDRLGLERAKRELMLSALKKLREEQAVSEEGYRRVRSSLLKERPARTGGTGKSDTGRG